MSQCKNCGHDGHFGLPSDGVERMNVLRPCRKCGCTSYEPTETGKVESNCAECGHEADEHHNGKDCLWDTVETAGGDLVVCKCTRYQPNPTPTDLDAATKAEEYLEYVLNRDGEGITDAGELAEYLSQYAAHVLAEKTKEIRAEAMRDYFIRCSTYREATRAEWGDVFNPVFKEMTGKEMEAE